MSMVYQYAYAGRVSMIMLYYEYRILNTKPVFVAMFIFKLVASYKSSLGFHLAERY